MTNYLLHFIVALSMVTASALILGTFALLRHTNKLGLIYAWYSYAIATWSFFQIFMIVPRDIDTSYFYARLSQAGVIFIPTLFLHFVIEFCDPGKRIFKKFLIGGYLFSTFTALSIPTPYFISGVRYKFDLLNFVIPGPLDYIFVIYFVVVVIYGVSRLAIEHVITKGEHSNLARLFFWGAFFAYLGGGANFFLTFDINIYPLTPFGTYGVVFNFLIVAYALFYYRLIDIESAVQVFQREKLATLGLLAASVNHEIKNPLYAAREILNVYIQNLKEGTQNKDPLLTSEKVKSQIDRVLEVITKLNRFAKPTDESVKPGQKASIDEAVQTVLELISYQFQLDKIKIINQLDPNLPQIQADQRQLEEILFNLIVNACHAMETGGTLVIAGERMPSRASLRAPKGRSNLTRSVIPAPALSFPRKRESPVRGKLQRIQNLGFPLKACGNDKKAGLLRRPVGTPRNDGFIQITITDTGTGISQEQMKHLFEPFHTTKGEKGTGLGLYITKQLVERNGGKISVSSKPNQGTSFILVFKTLQN